MEILFGDGHLVQMLDYRPGRSGSAQLMLVDTGKPQMFFRYLILKVSETDDTAQFSAWQFTTSTGAIYTYPSCMTLSWSNNISFFTGEGLSKAVISDIPSTNMGKACFKTKSGYDAFPKYFMIDLHDSPIDVLKYSRWRWHTSNDTQSSSGRNLRSFELFMTNEFISFDDHTGWKSVDSQTGYVAPAENYALAYTGKIKAS